MNKKLYRIVFNQRRAQWMAVAESAGARSKGARGESDAAGIPGILHAVLRPAVFAVYLALGLVLLVPAPTRAQIVADPTAPSSQRPVIVNTANGLPQVNIQTPSAAGVSRNTFRQFDVQNSGAILNNSNCNVQTRLGGWIQGNALLAGGSARVILNEVNSSEPSQLRGYVEVAGQRAEVIIANPAGIQVNGGGFLNASGVTLSTGTAIMNHGNLEGYRVQRGAVSIDGAGLDTSSADYTHILARAAQVNAGVWAQVLKVSLGANEINAANTTVTPIAGTGAAPAYLLDVAQLGGMYAGKIFLVGTEAGLGARNSGVIGASAGDVSLSTSGWLSNSGKIQAAGSVTVSAASIENTATGEISGVTSEVTASQTLSNRGLIDGQDTRVIATTLDNLGTGRIYGDHLSIGVDTLNNDAETVDGITRAATLAARGRLDIGATTLNNREHALIFSAGDLAIAGGLDASRQAIGAATDVNNASASIEAGGNLGIASNRLRNTNEHFATEIVANNDTTAKTEYQGEGFSTRWDASQLVFNVGCEDGTGGCWNDPDGNNVDKYTIYSFTRSTSQSVVTQSDPARILAGNNLTLQVDDAINDKSRIVAGGALAGTLVNLQNIDGQGQKITHDIGTSQYTWTEWHGKLSGRSRYWSGVSTYAPADSVQTIQLPVAVAAGNSTPAGSGVMVPSASLFQVAPAATANYLIETDARFTNSRQWLSSDFMLQALALDPSQTQKRLGDGFYEQRLIREQVAELTGRRFLGDFTSDEQQFRALMDAGLTYARQWNLRPGIVLTAAQVAQLTSDIVWLGEQEVTLPDGSRHKVLVPQVYVRPQVGDLADSGALLAGRQVNLRLSGDLNNAGTIAGRQVVSITAENVHNLAGRIQGGAVEIDAGQDVNNVGGTIQAENRLAVGAGRDINVISTTHSSANQAGASSFSRTGMDRVAGLYVTRAAGILVASAGRDASIIAGVIANGAADSEADRSGGLNAGASTTLTAGKDIRLGTASTASSSNIVFDADSARRDSQSAEQGGRISSAGSLTLQAGHDIHARAASVQAGGALEVVAGGNVGLQAGQNEQQVDEVHRHTSSGLFSSTSTATRQAGSRSQSVSSSLGGNTVSISSGKNIQVQGSNIVSDAGTSLNAGHDITLAAAQNTQSSSSYSQKSESGLMSGGNFGISVGEREQSLDQANQSTLATASTVGSVGGHVALAAGHQYRQIGSDVMAPAGDVSIRARSVEIAEVQITSASQTEQKYSQSGLTLAVSNPVLSAMQSIDGMARASAQITDGRMKALATANAGLAAYGASSAVRNGQGSAINGKPGQFQTGENADGTLRSRDANAADKVGGISLSISLGSSSSQSRSSSQSSTAQGATVAAGGSITIKASGGGEDSNILIQGSTLQAGSHASLQADNKVLLLAATHTASQTSSNSSSSGSVGAGYGSSGFTFNAAASQGQGRGDGADLSYANTRIEARQLGIDSGGDTTLRGAVLAADSVRAEVGGNLSIESLQDSSRYSETQSSTGFSISVPMGIAVAGVSLSDSQTDIASNYRSANEQSGIQAGDGGFELRVEGNTDLKGGVIASSDSAIRNGSNTLSTGTLTFADLDNQASASARSSGFSMGTDMLTQGKYGATKAVLGNALGQASESGGSAGQTRSAVSAGLVTITDDAAQVQATGRSSAEMLASLNRDTGNAHTAAQKQDVQAIKQRVEAELAIRQEAVRQITTLSDESYRVMFRETPRFYKISCPVQADCIQHPEQAQYRLVTGTPEQVQAELARADKGAVLAVNGIDNPLERAAQLAMQNAEPVNDKKPDTIYLMHYLPANNGISELLVAAYEKSLASTLGYSNQDQAYAAAIKARGNEETVSLGHSRGTLVQSNANTILAEQGHTNGNLSVRGVGGAEGEREYFEGAVKVTGADSKDNITYNYFKNDQVPVVAGGNPGVLSLSEFWRLLTTSNSAHSCYGTGAAGCQQVEILTTNGPAGAMQDNSSLIRYQGGRRVDAQGKPVSMDK